MISNSTVCDEFDFLHTILVNIIHNMTLPYDRKRIFFFVLNSTVSEIISIVEVYLKVGTYKYYFLA